MTCPFVNPTSGYRIFSRLVSLRTRPSILTSTAVSLATFAHNLAWRLVDTQALEGRRAQLAGARPFHELELCHGLGLDEMGCLRRRPRVKRALFLLEWFHQRGQLFQHGVSETGSNLACVHQLAFVVIADEQRARVSAALAFAFQPTADHQ